MNGQSMGEGGTSSRRSATGSYLQTLSRGIQVLRLLDGGRRSLTLTEIAKQMELNRATAFRLVQSLLSEGLLVRDSHDRYGISYGLLGLGHVLLQPDSQAEVARPILEWAQGASGETAHFNIREGDMCVVIAAVPSAKPVRYVLNIGFRTPLYAGAAGLAILAHLRPSEIDRLLSSHPTYPANGRPVDIDGLRTRLQAVREQGYAHTHGERVREAAGVAAPVYGYSGSILGSVAVIGPEGRLASENAVTEAAGVARQAAQRLGRRLAPDENRGGDIA